jgi:NADH:ubiquinone oxidoreductase subunit 3 (subunit A)
MIEDFDSKNEWIIFFVVGCILIIPVVVITALFFTTAASIDEIILFGVVSIMLLILSILMFVYAYSLFKHPTFRVIKLDKYPIPDVYIKAFEGSK